MFSTTAGGQGTVRGGGMRCPRDGMLRAVGSDRLAPAREHVDPADGFRDERAVLIPFSSRFRSDEPDSRPVVDSDHPTHHKTDFCANGDPAADVSPDRGADTQADGSADAAAHAAPDPDRDAGGAEPPRHARAAHSHGGRAHVRYGRPGR